MTPEINSSSSAEQPLPYAAAEQSPTPHKSTEIAKKKLGILSLTKAQTITNAFTVHKKDETSQKAVHVSNRHFETRSRTLSEIHHALMEKLNPETPQAQAIWSVLLVPIACLMRIFYPGKVYDPKNLEPYADPHHRFAISAAMEEMIDLLEGMEVSPDSEDAHLLKCLKAGTQASQKLQTTKGNDKEEFLQNFVKDIAIAAQSEKAQTLAMLPTGYWDAEKNFEPQLLSLYKDNQSTFTISIMGYGGKTPIQIFTKDPPPTEDELKDLITFCLSVPLHPPLPPPPSLMELQSTLNEELQVEKNQEAKQEELSLPTTPAQFCIAAGLSEQKQAASLRANVKTDPVKLLYHTISHQFPEANIQDKALFAVSLAHRRFGKVISAATVMKPEDKTYWMNRLEEDHQALKRRLKKVEISANSADGLETLFTQHIEGLQNLKQELETHINRAKSNRRNLLNKVPSKNFELGLISSKPQAQTASVPSTDRLTTAQYQMVQDVLQAADGEAKVKAIQAIAMEMERLVTSENYESVVKIFRNVQTNLTPGGYLDRAKEKLLFESFIKIEKVLWKAKEKKFNSVLLPDEMIYALSLKMEIHKLGERMGHSTTGDIAKDYLIKHAKIDLKNSLSTLFDKQYYIHLTDSPLLAEKFYHLCVYCWSSQSFTKPTPSELSTYKLEWKKVRSLYNVQHSMQDWYPLDPSPLKASPELMNFPAKGEYKHIKTGKNGTLRIYSHEFHESTFGSYLKSFPSAYNSSTETEVEALMLRKAVNVNPQAPLDEYALRAIKQDHPQASNLQEVFDLILQRPYLLDQLDINALGIPSHETHKKLYDVLLPNNVTKVSKMAGNPISTPFPSLPAAALITSPEYFKARAPLMHQLLKQFAEEKNYESYCFTLYLCDLVHQHAVYLTSNPRIDGKLKDHLKEITHSWPSLSSPSENGFSYFERGLEMAKNSPSFIARTDMETYLLNMAVKKIEQGNLSEISNNHWPHLLHMASRLKLASEAATLPGIARQAVLTMEERLIPKMLDSLPTAPQRNALFNEWLTLANKEVPEGNWEEGEPGIWTCGKARIDLLSLRILSDSTGASSNDSFVTQLPKQITNHPTYQTVFGKELPKEEVFVRMGSEPGEMIYMFSDANGTKYELTPKAASNITLKRQGPEQTSWELLHFFAINENHLDPSGMEKNLQTHGVWIDANTPSQGKVFLGTPSSLSRPEDIFHVILSSGKIQKLTSHDGYKVVNNQGNILTGALGVLPDTQTLYLQAADSNDVTKIAFLNQQMSLSKDDQKIWRLQEQDGELDGAEWIVGQNKGAAATAFLQSVGVEIEEIGLAVKKDNRTHLLLWPQKASVSGKGFYDKNRPLTFTKEKQIQPPLTITLDEGGKIISSAAGYMYLAYLCALKHDFANASLYIERSRAEKIESEAEKIHLEKSLTLIQELPVHSTKAAALALKGILAGQQIRREQLRNAPLSLDETPAYLEQARKINEAYTNYERWSAKKPLSSKQASTVVLTGAEITEAKHAANESLSFAFAESDPLLNPSSKPLIDLALFKQKIKKNPDLLGLSYTKKILASMKLSTSNPITREELINKIYKSTGIHLLEIMRSQEFNGRISELESQVSARKAHLQRVNPNAAIDMEVSFLANPNSITQNSWSFKGDIASTTQQMALETTTTFINSTLEQNLNIDANNPLLMGLTSASEELNETIGKRQSISQSQLKTLKKTFKNEVLSYKNKTHLKKSELLQFLKEEAKKEDNSGLPKELLYAIKHAEKTGDEGIMYALTQAYQMSTVDNPTVLRLMTEYLLTKTAFEVLNKRVREQLNTLDSLKDTHNVEQNVEWINASTRLLELATEALDFNRYFNENGQLLNSAVNRKVMVMEASQGIVVTKEQLSLINQMVDNPLDWYELKVGMGKTSVVFPIVLMTLIEKGEFPTALVKEELLGQQLKDLDRATRHLLESAGVKFSFSIKDPISPLILKEQYARLLQVEISGGYPITSISNLIAIDQKILLHQRSINSTQDSQTIQNLQEELFYLRKIREKLDLILVDEVDDILNIACENNVGLGEIESLNVTIQSNMQHIMRIIYTSENKEVKRLCEALIGHNQASLTSDQVKKELLPALVGELLNDPQYRKELENKLISPATLPDLNTLVQQFCHPVDEKDNSPDLLSLLKDDFSDEGNTLGALKDIIQIHLPMALKQNPGIEAGVKNSDGFQIGPKVAGNEVVGSIFSDEADLVVNHYLYYGIELPKTSPQVLNQGGKGFAETSLEKLRFSHPKIYQSWKLAAQQKGLSIIDYLNIPQNYADRLLFLEVQILDKNLLLIDKREIKFNVQDIYFGRRLGGMTGTRNRHALPQSKNATDTSIEARTITAKVLLEASLLKPPKVDAISENEEQILVSMQETANDYKNKAIINQGYYLKFGDAQTVVAELRRNNDRDFVFVDTNTRQSYLWKHHVDQPEPVSRQALEKLAATAEFKEKGCFYFGPPDTRGTDFKIPPGNGVTFLSPRCSMDDFVQTLGRMRGAGNIHSMDLKVGESILNRIKEDLSYGAIISDIYRQEIEEQQGRNLKTVIENMRSAVKIGTLDMLTKHPGDYKNWQEVSEEVRAFDALVQQKIREVATDPIAGWLETSRSKKLSQSCSRSQNTSTKALLESIAQLEEEKIKKLASVLESLKSESPNEESCKQHLEKLQLILSRAQTELDQSKKRALEKLHEQQQMIYPSQMPNGQAIGPITQAQVQQVQQQQVQQQVQQQQTQSKGDVVLGPGKPKVRALFETPTLDSLYGKKIDSKNFQPGTPYGPLANHRSLLQTFDIQCSPSAMDIFTEVGGAKGDPSLFRLLITSKDVCVISRQDFHEMQSNSLHEGFSIFSIINGNLVLNQGQEDSQNEMLSKIAQAKVFLGIPFSVTPEGESPEKEAFGNWISNLIHQSIITLQSLNKRMMTESVTNELTRALVRKTTEELQAYAKECGSVDLRQDIEQILANLH